MNKKHIKPLAILLAFTLILFSLIFLITYATSLRKDVIIKQNNNGVYVKKYKTKLYIDKSLKSFKTKTTTKYLKYKPNELITQGTIIYAQHSPHIVKIKTVNKIYKNNKPYLHKKTFDVAEYFTCSDVEEIQKNINKNIKIHKTYYPKEKIVYEIY